MGSPLTHDRLLDQPTVRKMTIASHGSPSGWCGRTAMKLPDQWPKQQFLMFLAKPLTMIKHHQPLTILSLFRDQDANVAPQYFAENCQGVAEGRFCFFYLSEGATWWVWPSLIFCPVVLVILFVAQKPRTTTWWFWCFEVFDDCKFWWLQARGFCPGGCWKNFGFKTADGMWE